MQRILVIEDSDEIREDIAEILELGNYQVDSAANGKDGVKLALLHTPDLVLCDITMPELDGYGVLLMLQRNKTTQHIPFIFITAKSEKSDLRKGMEMGADDYIIKPFDGTDVLNAVEGRLRKAAALREVLPLQTAGIKSRINLSTVQDYLEGLRQNRHTNYYKKKQEIYTEGNLPSRLFYINKGKVKTYKRNRDGKELILRLYNEGDFFGYIPLLEGTTYTEYAEALEACELAVIPRHEFEELFNSNPQVMKKIIAMLTKNLSEQEDHLLAMAYNSLRKKVADTLLAINEKYNPQKKEDFEINMDRENLASIAGVAKESFIRILGELKDEQVISITNSVIQIKNLKKLQNMHN